MLPALLHAVVPVPVPGSSALQHARASDKERSQPVSSLHTSYPSRRGGRLFCLFLVLCCWPFWCPADLRIFPRHTRYLPE